MKKWTKKSQKPKDGMVLVLNGSIDLETYEAGELLSKENIDGMVVLKLIIAVLTDYMEGK